jgi:hypothetical protein
VSIVIKDETVARIAMRLQFLIGSLPLYGAMESSRRRG